MPDLIIFESVIKLSPTLINLLDATSGSKIAIGYIERKGSFIPIISKSDSGNKLTTNNTVIFKGDARDTLLQYGDEFSAEDDFGTIILHGNKPFTQQQKEETSNGCYLDISIIQDTNYNIQKFKKFEL